MLKVITAVVTKKENKTPLHFSAFILQRKG